MSHCSVMAGDFFPAWRKGKYPTNRTYLEVECAGNKYPCVSLSISELKSEIILDSVYGEAATRFKSVEYCPKFQSVFVYIENFIRDHMKEVISMKVDTESSHFLLFRGKSASFPNMEFRSTNFGIFSLAEITKATTKFWDSKV
jgi:hypothetical protein